MMAVCTPEQRVRYLEPYARGEISACLAATEPNAGGDVAGVQTRAVKKGDKWILNGRKMWINRADWSSFMIVLASTDKELGSRGGLTAFLVDRGTPGVTIERRIATIVAERPCEITFDDVELDESQVLGEVGWAFPELQNRFSVRRVEVAMRCIGASERLLELLVEQANNRVTFGAPLASRQAIQWWIADATTGIHAARLMAYNAAWKIDQGKHDIRYEASMLKVFATELVGKVADWTLQAHGGMGVAKEMPIEFFYRLCRIWRIVEGPSEVHRIVIARNRLKGLIPTPDI
jgi:alkylation response protein AidB-like acyl-CoA dehydrogenase